MREDIYILGAMDPEMAHIEEMLRQHGRRAIMALNGQGREVSPREAYGFATLRTLQQVARHIADGAVLVLVECRPEFPDLIARLMGRNVVYIDHHAPHATHGLHEYAAEPVGAVLASSIFQVWRRINLKAWNRKVRPIFAAPPKVGAPEHKAWERQALEKMAALAAEALGDLAVVAAADHNLVHAYSGQVPGVDPEAVAEFRIRSRAEFQGVEPDVIRQRVEDAMKALESAPRMDMGGVPVADLMDRNVPELPEAAARTGTPFLSIVNTKNGRKVGLMSASAEAVRYFMEKFAPSLGLTGIYGDPDRGFAGGFEQG